MPYRVEIWSKEDDRYKPYRDGRRFKESSSAYRLMDRVQARFPSATLRVELVPPTPTKRQLLKAIQEAHSDESGVNAILAGLKERGSNNG